ncbi:MAG TPA: hypothetical protein VN493_05805 [Thermoanaerobaculia bacterium]|nr:hypothetical protein [Thermoanaerobaculia bacterium]
MSEPLVEPKRPSSLVKCEKHGLHYDPARMDGCVICRREAGGGTATRSAASAPRGSMGQALAVTAILLVLTTVCLYFVHGMAIETFQAWTGQGPAAANALDDGFDQQVEDLSFPEEDTGGETYSGSEGN